MQLMKLRWFNKNKSRTSYLLTPAFLFQSFFGSGGTGEDMDIFGDSTKAEWSWSGFGTHIWVVGRGTSGLRLVIGGCDPSGAAPGLLGPQALWPSEAHITCLAELGRCLTALLSLVLSTLSYPALPTTPLTHMSDLGLSSPAWLLGSCVLLGPSVEASLLCHQAHGRSLSTPMPGSPGQAIPHSCLELLSWPYWSGYSHC